MKEIYAHINLSELIASHQSEFRENSWIDTHSGKFLDFMNIREEDICMEDIAQGLSLTGRFAGQISRFYSVAEHSVLVYRYCKSRMPEHLRSLGFRGGPGLGPLILKAALMHDSAEAYIGDVTTPLKLLCPGFQIIEDRLETAIRCAFGIETRFSHPMVKESDRALFEIERSLFRDNPEYKTRFSLPEPLEVQHLSPEDAKREFLACVDELGIRHE